MRVSEFLVQQIPWPKLMSSVDLLLPVFVHYTENNLQTPGETPLKPTHQTRLLDQLDQKTILGGF